MKIVYLMLSLVFNLNCFAISPTLQTPIDVDKPIMNTWFGPRDRADEPNVNENGVLNGYFHSGIDINDEKNGSSPLKIVAVEDGTINSIIIADGILIIAVNSGKDPDSHVWRYMHMFFKRDIARVVAGLDPDSRNPLTYKMFKGRSDYTGENATWEIIKLNGGLQICHGLSSPKQCIKNGDKVNAGDILGMRGDSGNSVKIGLHLHIERIPKDGKRYTPEARNPLKYFQKIIGEEVEDSNISLLDPFDNYAGYKSNELKFVARITGDNWHSTGMAFTIRNIDKSEDLKVIKAFPFLSPQEKLQATQYSNEADKEKFLDPTSQKYTFRFGGYSANIPVEYRGIGTRNRTDVCFSNDTRFSQGICTRDRNVRSYYSADADYQDKTSEVRNYFFAKLPESFSGGNYELCARSLNRNDAFSPGKACKYIKIYPTEGSSAGFSNQWSQFHFKGINPLPIVTGHGTAFPFDISIDTTDLKSGTASVLAPDATTFKFAAEQAIHTYYTPMQGLYRVRAENLGDRKTDVQYRVANDTMSVLVGDNSYVEYDGINPSTVTFVVRLLKPLER